MRYAETLVSGMGLGVYREYLRISFQNMLAFRARYYVGVITYLVHVAVYYFIYRALFDEGVTIYGYTLADMLTYVAIGWVSKSLYLNYIDRDMAADVRTGHIAMHLIKPIDLQLMYAAHGLGQALFRLLLFTPPVLIATAIFFEIKPPVDWLSLVLFIVSTGLSALIYLGINFLIGLTAVYFLSIEQILYSKNLVIELFSGLLIPINWFPSWFQTVSAWLPFQGIAYIPLSIYLGRLEGQALWLALGQQLLWSIILVGLGRLLWLRCQARMLIQGG